MAKGSIEQEIICLHLRRWMESHPYDPDLGTRGHTVPEPDVIEGAVIAVYLTLGDSVRSLMLLSRPVVEANFSESRALLNKGGAPSSGDVVAALVRDIMRAYVAGDAELMAEQERRRALYNETLKRQEYLERY